MGGRGKLSPVFPPNGADVWLVRVGEGLARVVEGLVTAVEGLAAGLGVAVEKGLAAPVENLAVGIAVGFEGLAVGLAVFENLETTEELVVAVDGAGSIDAGLVVAVDSGLVVGLLGPVDSGLVVGLLGPVDSGLVVGLLGVLGEGAGETRGGRGDFGRGACLGSGGIRVPLNGFGGLWGRFREVDTEVTGTVLRVVSADFVVLGVPELLWTLPSLAVDF